MNNDRSFSFLRRWPILRDAYLKGSANPGVDAAEFSAVMHEVSRLMIRTLRDVPARHRKASITAKLREDMLCERVKYPERLQAVRLKESAV